MGVRAERRAHRESARREIEETAYRVCRNLVADRGTFERIYGLVTFRNIRKEVETRIPETARRYRRLVDGLFADLRRLTVNGDAMEAVERLAGKGKGDGNGR